MDNYFICPFMSTPEKKVPCIDNKCALHSDSGKICSLNEALDDTRFFIQRDFHKALLEILAELKLLNERY